ncbi:hypothetical protein RM780_04195 [Streptomyces sp. DSM 44917]|uniref:Helix-turn-helix domain-containing protein n=1 Tax=Streptomyces boetiae TaxID=3075541 RepID=A0ABU2L4B4_9ACTN|nr:hypothetical protein [Streptomyces sp. DSM 44917]MDT0306163.1 hypothetical protein [Streptomyces sp. DSM 44917]
MSTPEDRPASGSVPNSWGNALAWKWAPALPTALRRGGFLTLLYALRAMANASGELRFHGDRKPIRIQDIAKAAGAREKDARRYLNAAIAAGVVGVVGQQRRGRPSLYVLLMAPTPLWAAAEDSLKASQRSAGKTPPPWERGEESSGHRGPYEFGPPRPELSEEQPDKVRATAAPMSSGHRGPIGSGHRGPNNPGIAMELPQEMAGLVEQPQVDGRPGRTDLDQSQGQDGHDPAAPPPPTRPRDPTRCETCDGRMIPRRDRPRTICHACETQTARTAS